MDQLSPTRARRRVLLVARFFPPLGGAGVHRSLGTVRHLADHGYDVTVLTGSGGGLDRWSPEDPGLLAEFPTGTEIHRVPGPEPEDPRWARRAERWLMRDTPWTRWWVTGAERLGREVGVGADLLYVSCAPYETAWVGARLSAALGVPWIADLEDPWAVDEMRVHPTLVQRRIDERRMRAALRTASSIVVCADETAVRLRAALGDERATSIPIGFDSAAFRAAPAGHAPGEPFRIVHTGSMHLDLGRRLERSRRWRRALGGMPMDVDIAARSHVVLLEALDRLLAQEPSLRGRVELHLAGNATAADRAAGAAHAHLIVEHGSLAHRDTVALMRSADLLFLPMQGVPPGRRAGLIPYKTFEYLAAERPILAAVPEGDVRDLLTPLAHATLVGPREVDALVAALRTAIAAGPVAARAVADGVDSPALRDLERERLVRRVAAVVDGVLGTPQVASESAGTGGAARR